MSITFVTGNKDKFKEAKLIIPQLEMQDVDLPEIQTLNIKELITHKLNEARKVTRGAAIVVEDQQMYIKCLSGLPGPFIKWFLKTLDVKGLADLVHKYKDHAASATTTLGFSEGKGNIQFFESTVSGKIVQPRGTNGWGWDPIFEIENLGKTFAELTIEEKNEISMRRKAFNKLKDYLIETHE